MMGILLPEYIFPDKPDHKPVPSAGAETAKVVEQLAVIAALSGTLVVHCEPHVETGHSGHPVPVVQATSRFGSGGSAAAQFPVGRSSNDVVMQWHAKQQRDHLAAINATANMQNNLALWASIKMPSAGTVHGSL
jgi:hypothetical protein